jgi:hypothetical protein
LHLVDYCQSNFLLIWLLQAETEICIIMADGMFITKINIDRHGPRLKPNTRHLTDLISRYQLFYSTCNTYELLVILKFQKLLVEKIVFFFINANSR